MAKKPKTDPQQSSLFKKEIPKMPEGYYSGDQPNPNLRAFVEQHVQERPYDPATDAYDVAAFDKPIETTKATAIYNMHTYWSKKPHDAIRQYIRHYTQPGDLVLDPFCGSGGTALAALMEGRKAIAIDRSPAATFITKNYCTPVDVEALQQAFEELKRKVKPEIDWLYETRCDRCGGKATTAYTVYSQVFQCPRCLTKVPLFDCVEVAGQTAAGKPKKLSACPHCYQRHIVEEISTRSEKFGAMPVLVSYLCDSGCKPTRGERRYNDADPKKRDYFEKYDLSKIREIEEKEIPHWYPIVRMMNSEVNTMRWGLLWRPYHNNISKAVDFFTHRNKWALGSFKEFIDLKESNEILSFLFSSILLNVCKMCGPNWTGPMGNTLYVPATHRELNIWSTLKNKLKQIISGNEELVIYINDPRIIISCEDARSFKNINANSVDYIFTDPPYSGTVQFGELNFIWEAWLGFDTNWQNDEIIINSIKGKNESDWANMIRLAFSECFRVLKPGHWLSLCYHDTSEGTWELIQDIMAETGFIADRSDQAIYIDAKQKAHKQVVADKVSRRDLVINFRKPRLGEITASVTITGEEDETSFDEKVRQIIRDYLGAHPGSSKDRIYDEVVSRMVRLGQMETHDFDGLLRQVADAVKTPVKKDLFRKETPNLFGTHELIRWYLKETELALADAAESAREDGAAAKLRAFMKDWLQHHPGADGVHYSDLFEHYIYAVADKPRRPLAEFLPDYFYKTEAGTWRLPVTDEEARAKEDARSRGLGRRVKRYLAQLDQVSLTGAIPARERPTDATLAEWIRHCKRAGLYEQGKLLYEKGGLNPDNLSESALVMVEEDYQVCVRMLARSPGKEQKRKARGEK